MSHLYDGIGFGFAKDCPAAAVYITTYAMIKSSLLDITGDTHSWEVIFLILLLSGGIGVHLHVIGGVSLLG